MTTPTGTIKASDIRNEFGASGPNNRVSLGNYRISQSAGLYSNLPLDSGIPQSGSISFSQLKGKRLNIVVDISGGDEYRVNMRSKYDNNSGITVIGGFISKPTDPSEKRILVSVNKKIGSDSGSINNVALRTGTWGNSASLKIILGSSATILGAGGKGGDFVSTPTTQSGTAVYAENCIHYRQVKGGGFVGPIWCKGVDPSPPLGQWTSDWYVGNQTSIPYGKGSLTVWEARRNWSGTSISFTANSGSPGSSAFGVDYPCSIINYGTIRNGFGGGGAGGYRSR